MKTVCIIPARGGSKGIINKNITPINNKPLISYTISHALESRVDKVYVTTDSDKIASVATECGAEVIFRPSELAEDTTTTEQTLTHALHKIEQSGRVDIVVYLSCTQPYRYVSWINTCVEKVQYDGFDSACVGYKTTKNYWSVSKGKHHKLWWNKYTNRQVRDYILQENTGAACATRSEIIRSGDRIGESVYIVETEKYNLDIHEQLDVDVAEILL